MAKKPFYKELAVKVEKLEKELKSDKNPFTP
jgi:hypothetical protein